MLSLFLGALALAGGLPSAEVTIAGTDGLLRVQGPTGEHVAPDAPVYLDARWEGREVAFAGLGEDLARGVPLAGVRGASIDGTLRLSLCEDGGTTCRVVDAALSGAVPPRRRGAFALVVSKPREHDVQASPYRADAQAAAQAAFAEAEARDRLVLLDFTAVWCPPCDLLAAEVLHAPEHAEVLEDYVLLQIDVDDPSSWALKDRYEVRGYPTLVIAGPDGDERDRVEGYLGAQATVAWLSSTARGAEVVNDSPEASARLAWSRLQQGDRELGAALLAEAEGAEDTVPYRLARMALEPSLEEARWLTEHAPERIHDWVYGARSLGDEPEGIEALRAAIRAGLPQVGPAQAADLLYVLGQLADDDAEIWYAAAAAAQGSAFTGEPTRDRGYWTWYARLLELAGHPDAAIDHLEMARGRYPAEPTWALAAAPILLAAARPDEALRWTEGAWEHAWGDNRLRLARHRVLALRALDRADEAEALVDAVLAEIPAPAEGVEVRTGRYREALRAALDEAP